MGLAKPKGQQPEAQRTEAGGEFELGDLGECCKLPSEVHGRAPAT